MNIITYLQFITDTYYSIGAFFFQKIKQTQYQDQKLQKFNVNYSLLLSGSQYLIYINDNIVNAQLQQYILLCDNLIVKLKTNVYTEVNLQFEVIQNQINASISNLSKWGWVLLSAQNTKLIYYTTLYTTSMSEILSINNISLNNYDSQIELNRNLDFNNIPQNTVVILTKV